MNDSVFRVLLDAYEAAGRGSEVPALHLCGLEEYRKRRLCEEPGWPEGRPTWEEFWRNSYEGLVKLRSELKRREVHHGLVGDVPTSGDRPIG